MEVKEQTEQVEPTLPESRDSLPTADEPEVVEPDYSSLSSSLMADEDETDTRDLELPDGSDSEKDGTGGEAAPTSGTAPAVPSSSSDAPATAPTTTETPPVTTEPAGSLEQQPPAQEQPNVQLSEATQPSKESAPEAPQPQKTREQFREELLPELEKYYALPEDLAAELSSEDSLNPGETLAKVLPKLAARMHFEMQASMVDMMGRAIPGMVSQTVAMQRKASELESTFYQRWPKLKGQEAQAIQAIQAYRMVNPRVTEQQLIEQAGAMAMLALGLDPLAETRKEPTPPAPPAPPTPPPHTPAGPGAVGNPVFQPKDSDNFFAALADAWSKEDL